MKLIISAVLLAMLAGCSSSENVTFIEPVKTTISVVKAPKPSPVLLKPVEFKVVTEATKSTLNTERVWYAITVGSYENIAYNTQEMLRVIREQKAAIRYYEGLYVPSSP
jgi:hypothetical protein